MAKVKVNVSATFRRKARKKRPGVHSKKRNSVNKYGKNYNKAYRGQGR